MITESFPLKKYRLTELQQFIKENMPSCRFNNNPKEIEGNCYVSLSYEADDMHKLTNLQNKWYYIDNPEPRVEKFTWFEKLTNYFYKFKSKLK